MKLSYSSSRCSHSGMSSIIVAGSTGAIGREVTVAAISEKDIARVVALSRRDIPPEDWPKSFPNIDTALAKQKLQVVAVDWEELHKNGLANFPPETVQAFGGHHAAAMCMGTTRKDAGSAAAFRHCDFDFVKSFAETVKSCCGSSLKHYAQVSSQGADANSWFLYMKTKGEADNMAAACGFPSVSIYRPGLLGRKDKTRWNEKLFGIIAPTMPVDTVGKAIVNNCLKAIANPPADPVAYFGNAQIKALAASTTQSSL